MIPPALLVRALKVFLLTGLLGLGTLQPLSAQLELGGHALYNNVLDGTWGLGARVGVNVAPVGGALFQIQGTADLYFPDCGPGQSCDLADFQVNGIFFLTRTQPFEPYVGAGISIQPAKGSGLVLDAEKTEVGPAAFIGSTLGYWGRAEPFVEAKFLFKDQLDTQFLVQFGLVYELGKTTDEYGR